MANPYFSLSEKVFDVTERYPALIDLLADNGFEPLRSDTLRKTLGKTISLESALRSRHFDPALFEQRMVDVIEQDSSALLKALSPEAIGRSENAGIRISGILPCPIRVQLVEHLQRWIDEHQLSVDCNLQAASMGVEHLRHEIAAAENAGDLSDLYLSAGFSVFFDRSIMGRFTDAGVFTDLTGYERLNRDFDNDRIDFKDPLHRFSIIGAVPAVFMVNEDQLAGRPRPERWSDLLRPEFENSLALPVRDLDLFNAVLLGIAAAYGEDGVRRLGRALHSDMHPAQMIQSGNRRQNGPAVTVMPYFFTQMAKESGPMKTVWPKDGAIASPIFLLTKVASGDRIQPLVDFLTSEATGRIFCAGGKFPTTNPGIDNGLSADQTFLWPGWDYLHAHDIGAVLAHAERIFAEAEHAEKGDSLS
ncbi:MAG: ABC transporter substrate-binding protein [Eubacteriales bacterium]|nr:ABC transporter substrate-binding protein [Eubacteriales bacterium]